MIDLPDLLNPSKPGVSDSQREFYSRVLTSYRGGTIKRGSGKSKTVRALQLFLRDQGFDVKADGIPGRETERALADWQSQNKLRSDGKAGAQTFAYIRETVTPLPRSKPAPKPAEAARPYDAANLPPPDTSIEEAGRASSIESGALANALLGPAPGLMSTSYPLGAGGARPDPTAMPHPLSDMASVEPPASRGVNMIATPPMTDPRMADANFDSPPEANSILPDVTYAATQRGLADEELLKRYLEMYADPRRPGSPPISPETVAGYNAPYANMRVPPEYGPAPPIGNISVARALMGR